MPLAPSESPLSILIRDTIARRGPIPFRDFMAEALYHPEFGYYGSGKAAIGRGGDFFTNVSVGPLFGALLARQFAQMWERLGAPAQFDLVEQGAHRGAFANDVLAALQSTDPDCFESLRYTIVEPGKVQREAQAAALAHWSKIRWVDDMKALPAFEGVHFSNELLDAFPVHVVRWTGDQWEELHVTFDEGRFKFVPAALSSQLLRDQLSQLPFPFPAGYTTEINLMALEWVDQLARKLERGYLLAIDYGFPRAEYYRPERPQGTLTGYASHQRVDDLLENPGQIDLTAHVDFTSIIERAKAAKLHLHGFTDQHHFMVGLGQLHFDDTLVMTPSRQREMRAFKTLMHPALMGASFRVLCLEKAVLSAPPLSGFQFEGSSPAG
ncbi:MAG: hypothetical protein JWL59_1510 [Chthoniobacteraceae bacterium]|nr:hypothetical protein [Chthoniobacteraceae bacterium]